MLDKLIWRNIVNAKWVIGGFGIAHSFLWYTHYKPQLMADVYGYDGNGGKMLRIVTDLTDEEIARLKHARRLNWHVQTEREMNHNMDVTSDQEMSDRGIHLAQEPYVEYVKRPPHDKYL